MNLKEKIVETMEAMEATIRLRTKIGDCEFDAEGPTDEVRAQFEIWKGLVESTGAKPPTPVGDGNPGAPTPAAVAPGVLGEAQLAQVFQRDDRRDVVTLRALLEGENRDAETLQLALYGFRVLRGEDEVPVTRLKPALEVSGAAPGRVNRTAAPLLRAKSVTKSGTAKGQRYRLTNKGVREAEELVRQLVQQLS